MISQLEELRAKAIRELDSVTDPKSLEAWRISYLGRKSPLTQILRGQGAFSAQVAYTPGFEAFRVADAVKLADSFRSEPGV